MPALPETGGGAPPRADAGGSLDAALRALAEIGPQAAAAEALLAEDPTGADRALAGLQDSSDAAFEALRRVLEPLPEPPAPAYAPQPGLADVHQERRRRADDGGATFAFGELGRVPAGVQLVLHRALATALELYDRRGGSVTVRLRRERGAIALEVELSGPAAPAGSDSAFAELADRAALYGGRLRWDGRRMDLLVPLPA